MRVLMMTTTRRSIIDYTNYYTPQEQAKHRKELVSALRSGEFTQTTGRLRDDKGFCCLGVGCELFRRDVMPEAEWSKLDQNDYYPKEYRFLGEEGVMPTQVREYFGFKFADGGFDAFDESGFEVYEALAQLNDAGKPFTEIADVIEQEPTGLVVRGGF